MARLTPLPAGLRFRDGAAHFEVVVPKTGGRVRRRRTVPSVDLREALDKFEDFKREVLGAIAARPSPPVPSPGPAPVTFGAYIERHLDAVCSRVKPKTAVSYRQFVRNHLLPYFGVMPLATIGNAEVKDFQGHLRHYTSNHPRWRGQPLSAASMNGCLAVLRLLLNDAFDRRLLVEVPRGKLKKEAVGILHLEASDDERRRFLAAFDDEVGFRRLEPADRPVGALRGTNRFAGRPKTLRGSWPADHEATVSAFKRFRALKPLFVVAFETGLRRSDLLKLAWTSVDRQRGVLRVTMQKTTREAVIPISAACRDALAACEARSPGSQIVFTDAGGGPVSEAIFALAFSTAKAIAGITRRFRPHDMRHTFASRLASRDVTLQVIARALGHSTIALTQRYAKPSDEAMRSIPAALAEDERK